MPSANKDRVTISLHLDKRLYVLLKRCSDFEKEPMSRIVDRVIEPYVEKYESDTLEDMAGLDSVMKEVRARKEEEEKYESMEVVNNTNNRLDGFARQLADFETNLEKYNMPKKLFLQFRDYVESETTKAEQEKVEKLKEIHKAESQRWLKITKKYPLPESCKLFTIKKQF